MSLECGCGDGDGYLEIPEDTVPAPNTLICPECRALIPPGAPHYRVRLWGFDEWGEETDTGVWEVCEACGDLAQALLDRGFCWELGAIRDDIGELHKLETGQ